MKRENILNFFKNTLISSSISIVMIFSLEITYRYLRKINFTYAQVNKETLKFLKIAFDNKYSFEELKELNRSFGVYTGLIYQPWVQIGNAPHENKFSIVKDGLRKTLYFQSKCKNPKTFWFFGGSTTYGTGVSWEDTLPSKFAQNLNSNEFCGRVINFGVPYHYSLQESIFLTVQLAKSEIPRPDYVFFIDGLNDFIQKGSSINKEPFFTPLLTKYFGTDSVGVRKKLNLPVISFNFALADYINSKLGLFKTREISNYNKPSNLNDEEVIQKIVNNIIYSNNFRSKLCESYDIKCYQFLQPVPYLHYKKEFNEKLTGNLSLERSKTFLVGYKSILNSNPKSKDFGLKINDASAIFANYKNGIPYVDPFHYSPRANETFAKHIFKTIHADLIDKKNSR